MHRRLRAKTSVASCAVRLVSCASCPTSTSSHTPVLDTCALVESADDCDASVTHSVHASQSCSLAVHEGAGRIRPPAVVRSLTDMMQWPYYNMCKMESEIAYPLSTLRDNLPKLATTSSAFSGVAAEGVAMNCICLALEHELHCCKELDASTLPVLHPDYQWSCELDMDADMELSLLPAGPRCRFGNILSFCSPKLRAHLNLAQPPYQWDSLWKLVNTPGYVLRSAPCRAHGNRPCEAHSTRFHACGSPCVDWSTFGKGRKLSGPTAPLFAVWACLMLILRPWVIMLENVCQFPVSLARELFGACYDADFIDLDAESTFGHCLRRNRRIVVMTLRSSVKLSRPLAALPGLFGRQRDPAAFTWRDVMLAKPMEIRSEYLWAKHRDSIPPSRPVATPVRVHDDATPSKEEFLSALIPSELDRLNYFLKHHSTSDCVMSLGQDPSYTRAAGKPSTLHTIVKNARILWSHEHGRFLTARETLIGQGFPVTNCTLQSLQPHSALRGIPNKPVSSYNRSRVAKGLPPRHRVDMSNQCGNSIFIPMVGSVLHFMLFFLQDVTDADRSNALSNDAERDLLSQHDGLSLWRRRRRSDRSVVPSTVEPEPVSSCAVSSVLCHAPIVAASLPNGSALKRTHSETSLVSAVSMESCNVASSVASSASSGSASMLYVGAPLCLHPESSSSSSGSSSLDLFSSAFKRAKARRQNALP